MIVIDVTSRDWDTFRLQEGGLLSMGDQVVADLAEAVLAGHRALGIDRVEVRAATWPARYEVVLRDGRRWVQTLSDRTRDPACTWETTGAWRMSEMWVPAQIRRGVVDLLAAAGVTKLDLRPR